MQAAQHTMAKFGWRVAAGVSVLALSLTASSAAPTEKKSLGFAIVSWYTAVYETKDGKEECPEGFAIDNGELWLKSLTPAERDKVTEHGTIETTNQKLMVPASSRTPTGVDICYHPTLVEDPPMRTVKGKRAFGLDLDGGKARPKTCSHQEFTSLDGKPGIDNQWYRLIGCTLGWRYNGYMELEANGELRDGHRAILVEVTNIDDVKNSNDVRVSFYQAMDPLVKDARGSGSILPGASYRAAPNYRFETRGKIVDGVLTTDPIDIHFPFFGNLVHADTLIKDARFELKIAPDGKGAEGLVAGYYDLESMWSYVSRQGYTQNAAHFSCPAMYAAAHRLADGYPDPETGQCTALSSAFKIEAVGAFVVHSHDTKAHTTGTATRTR